MPDRKRASRRRRHGGPGEPTCWLDPRLPAYDTRMLRKALLIVCGVLLVATATLAVSSYWWAGAVYYTTTELRAWFSWDYGSVDAVYDPVLANDYLDLDWIGWNVRLLKRPTSTTEDDAVRFFDGWVGWWRSVQFSFVRTPGGAYTKLPACVPVMVLALPTWFLARPLHRARHRPRRGLCLSCGYDLAGNMSGRCPECGEGTDVSVESATSGEVVG